VAWRWVSLSIIAALLGGLWSVVIFVVPNVAAETARRFESEASATPAFLALAFSIVLVAVTFVIAAFTRKQSRSDVAKQVLDSGMHSGGSSANPLLGVVIALVMLGLLYGNFLVIDAVKATWVRHRLRAVDRHRAATILAMVFSQPADIETRTLQRLGETAIHLRTALAYLIAYEWVDISADGRYLRFLSPAKRVLRE